jgi:hypothetical protein
MQASPVRLRFGILVAGHEVPAWAAECIERLEASGLAELVLLLDVSGSRRPKREPRLLHRLYQRRWLEPRARALQPVDVSQRLSGVSVVQLPGAALATPAPSRPEAAAAAHAGLSDAARQAVGAARLDFVLRLSAVDVPSELLDLPRFGVWSYCQERRAAPCFREVLEGRATTRMALERLTPRGPVCLHEGYFSTCRASWVNNVDRARFGAADFCARVCAEIAHGGEGRILALQADGPPPGAAQAAADERPPRNRDVARLLASSAGRSLQKLWELMFHMEIWNVGFSAASVEQILHDARVQAPGVTWCKPHKRGHFIADPFAYVEGGRTRLLVEDYDQVKGKICRVEPTEGERGLELAVDLEFPYHLSYPCIFEENGETFCVPEAYQSQRASLYRRTPQGWQLVRHLIEGLPIVDPTLFKHEGRYWLLFTLQNDGAWGNQKLYAYHAPALDAPWVPHALNPIKCDIGATRPAGNVFRADGRLYRPSQDCSVTYGGAVVINEIVTLSATQFEERVAARIDPIAEGPYPHGLHTLNAMGSGAVFDSKRFEFDWLAWRKNWGRLHEVLR